MIHLFRSYYIHFVVSTVLFFVFTTIAFAAKVDDLHIEKMPQWVEYRALAHNEEVPVDEITDGVFYQLLDTQIKVTDEDKIVKYYRYVETVVNKAGVDYTSQVNIDFDPTYQKLALNTLFIIRDGKRIDKLKSAKISLLNRETDLENQIYNGTITLNALLDDIQIGDTIDYSFTRYGSNPVYKGIFSYSRELTWSVPVQDQYVRVLWGKVEPLFVRTRKISPKISQKQLDDYIEYQVHIHDAKAQRSASETPSWYNPYGYIEFSENKTWSSVVKWAETLYPISTLSPSVIVIANNIKSKHSSIADQIVAALKYTQKNIRYVGLEMGVNSHLPTPAHETLTLKYGDCKDKAVLFIALLKALNIEAYPVLVNTTKTKLLAEILPAVNVFDHVIVKVEYNNEEFWLDPTLSYQAGPLKTLFQPDYGFALIIKSGESKLTSMARTEHNSSTVIRDSYVIPDTVNEAVIFNVKSKYVGNLAQNKRRQIEQDGSKKLTEDYEIYYQRIYPKLVKTSDVVITDDIVTGLLTLTENYSIDEFWEKRNKDFGRNFYPTDIRNAVYMPKQVNRNSPLWFDYPNNISHQIILKFQENGWEFNNSEFIEDNDFFFFKRHVDFTNDILTLTYTYKSKTDHIATDRIDDYITSRDRMRKKAYYGLTKYADEVESANDNIEESESLLDDIDWFIAYIIFVSIGLIFVVTSWRLESKTRPIFVDNHFFPISLVKFLTLSIVTIGSYNCYWMYRNWKDIKQSKQLNMMPIARGFFSLFWFYPLFLALRNDSVERYSENRVMLPLVAGICAALYLLVSLLANYADGFTFNVAVLCLPLLFIPFVNYINQLNGVKSEAYQYNSIWNIRSIIAIVIFLPLSGYTLVQHSFIFPSSAVISQQDIAKRDMKYFYRQDILPANETIQYFYSDAFFNIRDDGNGFTSKRVFSYWQDDDDGFQIEIAMLKDIKDISVNYAKSDTENTIITITRNDNSDFKLFVSPINEGDKVFTSKLNELWQSKQLEN